MSLKFLLNPLFLKEKHIKLFLSLARSVGNCHNDYDMFLNCLIDWTIHLITYIMKNDSIIYFYSALMMDDDSLSNISKMGSNNYLFRSSNGFK